MKTTKITIALGLTMLACGIFFVFGNNVLAGSSYDSTADNPGSILNNPFAYTNAIDFFAVVLKNIQGIIAFLAVMFIIIGGILYITAGGNQKMTTIAKTCIVSAIIGLALAAGGPSFLRQMRIAIIGDLVTPVPTDLSSAPAIRDIVDRVLTFLLSIVGMLGIIGLTISGAMYIFAIGDSDQAQNAKKAMTYSIIGIAFAGASLLLVRQIVIFFTP